MKLRNTLTVLLILSLVMGLLTGCQGNQEGATKDSLIIATENEPPSLTPTQHDALAGVFMNLLTYNGLVKFDMETLDVQMDLASDYKIEDDLNWIFTLKEGVKFHDGSDFNAEDVKASLEWAKSFPESQNYTKNIKSVEVVDDYTVRITTEVPYGALLFDLGYHFNFIVPKELIDSGNDFNANPIGTGPYKFKEWKRGDSLSFERFDDYFDTENVAKIKDVVWRIIPEGTARTIALEAGEVDFVYEVETTDINRLKDNPDVEVKEVTSVVNWFLTLNKSIEPFNDPNFRKAINAAIDRDAIITSALNGYGVESISAVPMGYAGSTEEGAEGYDLDKAKDYLEAWGGDISQVKLPILSSNDTKARIATVMQANLADIGLDVEIVSMDLATYLDDMARGDYVAAITSWSPSNSLTYVQRFHSRRNDTNPGSLIDENIDRLVEQAESELDPEARIGMIEDIVVEVNALCPQPSLYQDVIFRAYNNKLAGVTPSATGYIYLNEIYWTE